MSLKMIIGVAADATIEITGETAQELIQAAAFWQAIPRECPMCGATLIFTFRQPQEDPYYGLLCSGTPAHEMNFGVHKQNRGGGLYYDEKKWKKAYSARQADEAEQEEAPVSQAAPPQGARLSAVPARFNRDEAIRRIRGHWKVIRELNGKSSDFQIALDKCTDEELIAIGKRAHAAAQELLKKTEERREQAR